MRGTIRIANHHAGLIALETESGEFTVFELLGGCDVDLGDEVNGDLESLGGETFYNETQGVEMDVYVEDVHSSWSQASNLVNRRV